MCNFIQIDTSKSVLDLFSYISFVKRDYFKYFKFLQDDFSSYKNCDLMSFLQSLSPYFWIITDYFGVYKGFVFLDNFIGNSSYLYSAELTTAFCREAWGFFTSYCAKIFLKKCFDELGLQKIKAQIYPDNFRVKKLLTKSGFVYETTLLNETLRLGKPQSIEVYGLYRNYYYKDEVNYER